MRIYLLLAIFAAVSAEYTVDIYSSSGELLTGRSVNVYIGDYIYCRFQGDVIGGMIYYGWIKEAEDGNDINEIGPNFISFPNEVDYSNRLYLGLTLGGGANVRYRCVATDEDPYTNRNDFAGAIVTFAVSPPPIAANIFSERDYADVAGGSISLLCIRMAEDARVVWETINISGDRVSLIYDSESPSTLPDNYELTQLEDNTNDYTLQITMGRPTAMLTRCSVTYNTLTDVSSTAMLYLLEPTTSCKADGWEVSNEAGAHIEFSGCDFRAFDNPNSMLTDQISTITYWEEQVNGEQYVQIESTRILDGESSYAVDAVLDIETNMYRCVVEVYRETALAIRAKTADACGDGYQIALTENTARHRLYYGNRAQMDDDDFINFGSQTRYRVLEASGADLTCEVDSKPAVNTANVLIHVMNPGETEWTPDGNHIIEENEIAIGAIYKCVYTDGGNLYESGIVHIVEEVVEVRLVDMNNEEIPPGSSVSLTGGEWVECQPVSAFSTEYPPQYVWHRSNQIINTNGPKQMRFPNTDDHYNRLIVPGDLGNGQEIEYRCIGIDILPEFGLPDFMGVGVRLTVTEATAEPIGTVFEPTDFAAFGNSNSVEYSCTRVSLAAHVAWEQVNEGGVVDIIYSTSDPGTIKDGYELINSGDELDFGLRITVTQETAIMTRCTVSQENFATITSSAMIYMIELADACSANNLEPGLTAGSLVTFSGCDVMVTVSAEAGNLGNTYSMMTFWQHGSDLADLETVERSRTIDGDSVLMEEALTNVHEFYYTCAVQIHREDSLVMPAIVTDMCEAEYQITVADDTVRFRVYHGPIDEVDFITFDALELYITDNIVDYDLTCEIDYHPQENINGIVSMEVQVEGQADWTSTGSHIVEYGIIVLGDSYRCAYIDDDTPENNAYSGEIHFITGAIRVALFDMEENPLEDGEVYQLHVGDYIECRPDEDINPEYPPKYIWRYSINSPDTSVGPHIIRYPNTDDHNNRLTINSELGRGEEIAYRCIGTDDVSVGLPDFMGTEVRFRAIIESTSAGTVFEARDYVGIATEEVVLSCNRNTNAGRVRWQTLNVDDDIVATIYDTDDEETTPPNGYELTGDNYDLRVTISQETAILTRCWVTEISKEDVSATAMIFLIEPSTCEEEDLQVGLPVGSEVTFSGCHVNTIVSDAVGASISETFTTMTFWQRSEEEDGPYDIIDPTRTLDGESILIERATMDSDNKYYTCGVQIHREEELVVPAVDHQLCAAPYHLTVEDETVGFRIYYGTRSELDDDDYIRFDVLNRYMTDPFTFGDITCEIDRKPEPGENHEVQMQYALPESPADWEDSGSNIIPRNEVNVGTKYRCAYVDPDAQNEQSGTIYIMQGVAPVTIHNQAGELMDQSTVYNLVPGDYVECRSAVAFYPEFRPKFVWHRSIQEPNINGPRQLRYTNTDDEHNQLPITATLGGGEDIAYRCIGTDDLSVTMIGLAGTLVRFRVLISDPAAAGIAFPSQEHVALVDEQLDLTCRRNNAAGRVHWQTLNADGEEMLSIFNSSDSETPLPNGYELVGGDSNSFDLRIVVSQATAILTRCTITEDGLEDTMSTTMIYALERIQDTPCSTDANGPVDVGDKVELSGCDASILINDESGIVNDDYEAVMYWEQQMENAETYTMIDESRELERESVYNIEMLSPSHNSRVRCAIQISRPNVLSASSTINNICNDDLTLSLKDDDVRFRIYYGDRETMADDDFLDFTAAATNVGKTDDADITCEIDRHPAPAAEDSYTMYERVGGEGDWNNLDSAFVAANDVVIGNDYKCIYHDNDGPNTESLIMRIVEGSNDLTGVSIYDENGELLSDDQVYTIDTNEYIECRPTDGAVVVPRYVWVKSIKYDAPGPNLVQNDNELSGFNRLYLNDQYGQGSEIAYRCIAGEDFGVGFQEFLGTRVDFRMRFPGVNTDGATGVHASLMCVIIAVATFMYIH